MAIQLPNPGLGDGQTGDNEFVMWTKVKDNFNNPDHAAGRMIGNENGQIPLAQGVSDALRMRPPSIHYSSSTPKGLDIPPGKESLVRAWDLSDNGTARDKLGVTDGNPLVYVSSQTYSAENSTTRDIQIAQIGGSLESASGSPSMIMRGSAMSGGEVATTPWAKFYTDANTTTDSNGLLKPSSPVLRVFNDRIEGNGEGDVMSATYTKNGVGDYTISGTTGLRTDGWYVTIPNDMNGNPKVAITLDGTDGVITLKTYVRTFDMTTFKFGPDLEQPLDIPEGRWIDLRFNDLPDEDDTQTEV
ncbi:MAG: hypothetical protein ACTIKC_01825 [Psychrobacter sp.]